MAAKSKKLTKEEEKLLQDFSRDVSRKSSFIFYFNAFFVSSVPLWIFWRIYQVEPTSLSIFAYGIIAAFILASTYAMQYAYKHQKFLLKHKIAQKVGDVVAKQVNKELADDKKLTRGEKDDRILWKRSEVADYQATCFSIFYINICFLFLIILTSCFIFANMNPQINFIISYFISAGLLGFLSTGSQ